MYLVGGLWEQTFKCPLESTLVWGLVRDVLLRFTTRLYSVVSCSHLRRSFFVWAFRFFRFSVVLRCDQLSK